MTICTVVLETISSLAKQVMMKFMEIKAMTRSKVEKEMMICMENKEMT